MGVISKSPSASLDLEAIRAAHPLPSVVAGAVPRLMRAGNEYKACCPFHSDRSPSFTVYDNGTRFQCFGCGAQGDVLDFVQRLHGVGLREAAELLTGGALPTVEVRALPRRDDRERTERARSIWMAAQPIQGTVAETYLRWRGLHLPLPDSLRFTSLRHGSTGRDYPCLVALVTGVEGQPIGIQRTYLADNGEGKADVSPVKMSLGQVAGGAIRLAPPAAELVVAEGLEDALTLQQEIGRAAWAAAGASMLAAMRFPDLVQRVAIGGDNDDAGTEAAEKAAQAFASRGLEARTFYPLPGFKDFSDELQGKGRA